MRRLHIAPSGADRDSGLLDARNREDALVDALAAARRAAGARSARVDHREQHATALEAERHLRQSVERPQEQAGADEEHEREGDLRQDEATRHRCVARCTGRPSAILHRVDGRAAGRAPRRRHAEDERRDEAGAAVNASMRVERQLQETRRPWRAARRGAGCPNARRPHRPRRPWRRAAGSRSATGAPAVRATRPAPAARSTRGCARRAGEQQVGDVGAGTSTSPATAIRTSSGRVVVPETRWTAAASANVNGSASIGPGSARARWRKRPHESRVAASASGRSPPRWTARASDARTPGATTTSAGPGATRRRE